MTTEGPHQMPTTDTPSAGTPQVGDAFGAILLSAHARAGLPTAAYEVTERDDGHVSVRDAHYYFAPVLADSADAGLLAGVSGRVLDIGCGAGRHLAWLRQNGTTALGIDASLGAVQVCARRGFYAVHGDILQPQRIGVFDVLLLLGGNLGLLSTPARAGSVLRALSGLASPGARLIAEGIDTATTVDPVHTAYRDANIARGRHPGQITMRVRHRELATGWIDLWYPAPSELADVAAGTGWIADTVTPAPDGPGYHVELIRGRS